MVYLVLFGLVIGTLSWEILERVVAATGRNMNLTAGPIGIDLYVLAIWIRVNPGSFLGTFAGTLLFLKL